MSKQQTFDALRTPPREQWTCDNCIHDLSTDDGFVECKLFSSNECNNPDIHTLVEDDENTGAKYIYNGKGI